MALETISVLLVEDSPGDARLFREAVREAQGSHIQLTHVDTLTKALIRLDQERFDVVMLDLSLPDADGLETLVRTHAQAPSVPIVVLTGLDDQALAMKAVREGAQDYIVKGEVNSHLLVRAMRYATERKRAVEALQRSEEYYRSLIENALDIITVLDADGKVRYGSPSFERVLGYPQGALTGTNVISLIHPEDVAHFRQMLELGSRSPGATQAFECRLRHRHGQWRVLEAIGKQFEQDTAVNGFVLNSRDITERKRAEDALITANETLRAVIETSPLAIYAVDLQGDVKSWNDAASRIFGYQEFEVIHLPLPIVAPEDVPKFLKKLQETAAGNLLVSEENRRYRKDGSSIDVSVWNAQLRNASGDVTGIVEVVADNTDRKRLEEQFRQAQKMEAVGRLAGGIAHDFNNLLTVINGYCQMMMDQFSAGEPMAEDMQQVLKASDRATNLTRQLLAFSRRQIYQPKVVDLGSLIGEMKGILNGLLGAGNRLLVEIEPRLGRVRVDPGHLEQVIVNFVVNARDAMPSGGAITIRLLNVQVDGEGTHIHIPPGAYVLLEVQDMGTGMDAEVLSHLFEPFFTTKEKGRGTGLGLSTSYGIVRQNGGEILVRSEVGVGTTFSVYLPQVEEPLEKVPVPLARPSHSNSKSETVLVVEDQEGVRAVVSNMLRKQGYHVYTASSGEEALELLRELPERIDLLLSDIIMPGLSGPELAVLVRAERPEIKVLFMSGFTETGIVREQVLDPGTAFLQKPFKDAQLALKMREVLTNEPEIESGSEADLVS